MKDVGFILIVVLILEVCFGLWLKHEGEDINNIMVFTLSSFCCIQICVVIMYCIGKLSERW